MVFLPYLALAASLAAASVPVDLRRELTLLNDSPSQIEVQWINSATGERVTLSTPTVFQGLEFPLHSFVGHEFRINEYGEDGSCEHAPEKSCRFTSFKVNEDNQQFIRINEDFSMDFSNRRIGDDNNAGDLIKSCHAKAKQSLDNGMESSVVMDAMVACVEGRVSESFEKVLEKIAFQATVRTEIAHMLENYTCLDDSLDSTPDVETLTWVHLEEDPRTVHVKHERAASRIHAIDNFIDAEECQAMAEAAESSLHHATVADGKGGSRLSENRKAMQAGITVPWELEAEGHPIARLSRRVYDYTNYVLGLNINEHGQEDLMSIQYFGRGSNDTEPDRYTPHCDGECTGQPHKNGTRMATLVMYCDVADKGGHTNFRNSGVHVKPKFGTGIFFSYINPETLIMDNGFTEHSGCPVFEGSKKIVTQWVRLGVDDENPWNSFNTLGIKKSLMNDQ